MGALVADHAVSGVVGQLNDRFAPGDPIKEMVAIEREFGVFSGRHSLASASALLNIGPSVSKDRRGWFRFLEHLKSIPSDQSGVNGHDRITQALSENLKTKGALPVYFSWHGKESVAIERGRPISFSKQEFLIVLAPVSDALGAG